MYRMFFNYVSLIPILFCVCLIEPSLFSRKTAEDVSRADGEGNLNAQLMDLFYLVCNLFGGFNINPVVPISQQGFASQFHQDSLVLWFLHWFHHSITSTIVFLKCLLLDRRPHGAAFFEIDEDAEEGECHRPEGKIGNQGKDEI